MGEPKGNPSQWKRKFFKVILMSASCCFHHSGQEMSLGLVTLSKCCQRPSRHLSYSAGPHWGRVHLITALISEPVLTGESICVNDGELAFGYISRDSVLQ